MGKKLSLKYLHIWDCPAEVRPYRPNEKKLGSKTVSYYFVGYSERLSGYKFYDPITKSIFEIENVRFFDDVEFARGDKVKGFFFEEEYVTILLVVTNNDQDQAPFPDVVQEAISDQGNVEEPSIQNKEIVPKEQTRQPLEPMLLRKSTRERRSAVLDDYIIFSKNMRLTLEW